MPSRRGSPLPWLAHLYTALGAVAALFATLDVIAGDYRGAFIWLGLQVAIDATDGLLARALHVKERLPHFDGARLDDIIDYLCYVFIPMVLVLHAELLPPAWGVGVAALVLLASAYGFSQTAAKVEMSDFFFTGFPSYWNVVVWYLYLCDLPAAVNAAILVTVRAPRLRAAAVYLPVADSHAPYADDRPRHRLGPGGDLDYLAPPREEQPGGVGVGLVSRVSLRVVFPSRSAIATAEVTPGSARARQTQLSS